eukprot:COSAG02_NODE_42340_length_385_cov_0.986014_1_plen_21_part_10
MVLRWVATSGTVGTYAHGVGP